MKATQTYFKYLMVVALFGLILQQKSYAGGFPVRPKKLLLSPSISYFTAKSGWDSLGRNIPFANNGRFTSVSYSLYAEYGLTKRFTLVALLPYVINNYDDDKNKTLYSGPTDLEVGVRYYLANINYIYYFTIQGTYIKPLYTEPNLGYGQQGSELKLSFAGSGKL